MSISNITSGYSDYTSTAKATEKKTTESKNTETSAKSTGSTNTTGVTYESTTGSVKQKSNAGIIAQMKADTEKRASQMQSMVTEMFKKQGITIGTADDMWKTLASGNFTADADTIAQAKEDVSENGYWGVNQTSDRLFSFALALSNGDEAKMEKMVAAVQKGFDEATKAWGSELPQISKDTLSATMEKFDNWFAENGSTKTTADILGN
jgi:hypothetical protein